jgi:alpha-galactosidase
LLIGTDLRTASPETLAILGNREIIAIDQDRLGVQGAVVADRDGLMVLDKPLAGGDHAIALYNATDSLATIDIPVNETGLPSARGYRLHDVWSGNVRQAKSVISAAVPAHGTVVYRVRPHSSDLEPLVTTGATMDTLVPGPDGETLTTTVTNRGSAVRKVSVTVQTPAGWTATATSPTRRRNLGTNESLTTTWRVTAPEGQTAGEHPLEVTAGYEWNHRPGTSTSELMATVVTAPQDGRRHLSTVRPVSTTGQVETDTSHGSLLTIAGQVFTRGLGTTAPSEILYYLGGRCSTLTTDVGLDDTAAEAVPATFTIRADETVAVSASALAGEPPRTLTADLTGANWLRLTTTGSGPAPDGTTINDHTDWAAPVLTCGDAAPTDPVLPAERTLVSFEAGTEDWTIANPGDGGTVTWSTAFHTDGAHGLAARTPLSGNWFGRALPAPLDLTGASALKFDVRAGTTAGTVGEIAVQVGPNSAWCQGGRWAWVNPGTSRTITEAIDEIECPAGVELDLSQVTAAWVFLNGGDEAFVDNFRMELTH